MGFIQAIESGFKNYFKFSGRASRSEFWYFVLFCFLAGIVANAIDRFVLPGFALHVGPGGKIPVGIAGLGFALVVFFPRLTLAVRRLHDKGKSGWWLLIVITIIGILPLIYWYCSRGDEGDNRFGADPLAAKPQS